MKYDYLIVGAGLFGSIFAHEATKRGKKCLVVDKRSHIGGNCYTENANGIHVHKYGPHIFNTSNDIVWQYINKFTSFNNFSYRPKANFKNRIFSLPINLMTFYQLWGTATPDEARKKLESVKVPIKDPKNFEEYALSQVGEEVYYTLIRGYTKKQWGRDPTLLPVSIIKRVPIRLTYDENYYNSKHQGIPTEGYTAIFGRLLYEVDIELGVNFLDERSSYSQKAKKIVYTGCIDEFFDMQFGKLAYRTLDFEFETKNVKDHQGTAGINYTDSEVSYTRSVEHKHFNPEILSVDGFTVLSREFSKEHFSSNQIPYYPINDNTNNQIYERYKTLQTGNVIFGGRLAEYKYYNMDQVILSALEAIKREFE